LPRAAFSYYLGINALFKISLSPTSRGGSRKPLLSEVLKLNSSLGSLSSCSATPEKLPRPFSARGGSRNPLLSEALPQIISSHLCGQGNSKLSFLAT